MNSTRISPPRMLPVRQRHRGGPHRGQHPRRRQAKVIQITKDLVVTTTADADAKIKVAATLDAYADLVIEDCEGRRVRGESRGPDTGEHPGDIAAPLDLGLAGTGRAVPCPRPRRGCAPGPRPRGDDARGPEGICSRRTGGRVRGCTRGPRSRRPRAARRARGPQLQAGLCAMIIPARRGRRRRSGCRPRRTPRAVRGGSRPTLR